MDGYSRLVTFLKVVLPLTALGLLSTLFLLSRSVDPATTLPFGDAEVNERLLDTLITAPYFSGTTTGGEQLVITAASAKPGSGGDLSLAQDMTARIKLVGGNDVTLDARTGSFDPGGDVARFTGDVQIETTTGFSLTTQALESRIKTLDIRSESTVQGLGPFGTLDAGRMELTTQGDRENAHLLFKDGVKLIYDPKNTEDLQ